MKRFCPHPFDRALISVPGDVYTCCSAWTNFPIGNIFKDSLERIWNSQKAQSIRESIFDGTFRYCDKNKCPRMVSGLLEKDFNDDYFQEIIHEKKVFLERGPRLISLNYDYSCNLSCKSCRNNVKMLDKERRQKLIKFQNDLIESDFMKNVKRVTVSGSGEVFASSLYMDLFKRINQREFPGIKIVLRTNGLLLTPENWERIKSIHYAIEEISISIDAARAETYQILRTGGYFKTLLKNLEFVKALKERQEFQLRFNFVVQKLNFREVPAFIELARNFSANMVVFSKLLNKNSYSRDEYIEHAVHDPRNPCFDEFKKIINHLDLKDLNAPVVDFTNLSNLIHQKTG